MEELRAPVEELLCSEEEWLYYIPRARLLAHCYTASSVALALQELVYSRRSARV